MRKRWIALLSTLVAAMALTIGALGTTSLLSAQGTPAATDHSTMMQTGGHPAHIHDGTCATLGGIAWPLNNLGGEMEAMGTPQSGVGEASTPAMGMSSMAPMGSPEASASTSSTTTIDATLDTLLGAPYALNVHESTENIQNYIACGDITGSPAGGVLEIQLGELNGSGFTGTATLTDNGDGTTTVYAEVTNLGSGTPVASPVG
jgi:hypothetical protein